MSTIYDAHLEIFIRFFGRPFSCFYFFLLILSMISLPKNEKCLGMFPSTINMSIDISIIYHIYIIFCLSIYSSFYLSVCLISPWCHMDIETFPTIVMCLDRSPSSSSTTRSMIVCLGDALCTAILYTLYSLTKIPPSQMRSCGFAWIIATGRWGCNIKLVISCQE